MTVRGIWRVPLEELQAHAQLLENGFVRIFHRCDQLTPDNLCAVYETRPTICREYTCASRRADHARACTNAIVLELRADHETDHETDDDEEG